MIVTITLVAIAFWVFFISSSASVSSQPDPPASAPTDEQNVARGCEYIEYKTKRKPISELSINDLHMLDFCKAIGK